MTAALRIEDIIEMYGEETANLARQLRNFLLKELKDIQEIPDEKLAIIGYGYGPGYNDLICTMMISKSGVKLGLNRGAALPDPQKLLTGTGKVHRFIIIKDDKTIHTPTLKKLIAETLKAYRKKKN